jgi:hypothetical protein
VPPISFEGKLKATGHGNRDEAVMVHSFEVKIPVMFGTESACGNTREDRSLQSLPTYQEWDLRRRGHEVEVQSRQEAARKCDRIRTNIEDHHTGEARKVAR